MVALVAVFADAAFSPEVFVVEPEVFALFFAAAALSPEVFVFVAVAEPEAFALFFAAAAL